MKKDQAAVFKDKLSRLLSEIQKAVVGQEEMVKAVLTGLFTGRHILLEGLPGLAKTLTITAVSKAVSLQCRRVQFTPDLLPTDIIGTVIFNPQTLNFTPKKGPVFTNILLADEINRAPAKVQSALLEAMEEKQVTIGDMTYPLPDPFLVLATQNPIEQEGTYPLPEAQRDRFLFKADVPYPEQKEEMEILNRVTEGAPEAIEPVFSKEDIFAVQEALHSVYIDSKIRQNIVDLVCASRSPKKYGFPELAGLIEIGASPRATAAFPLAARAQAFFEGRNYVSAGDIRAVAPPILRHRLILSYEAQAEEKTADQIIATLLKGIFFSAGSSVAKA